MCGKLDAFDMSEESIDHCAYKAKGSGVIQFLMSQKPTQWLTTDQSKSEAGIRRRFYKRPRHRTAPG